MSEFYEETLNTSKDYSDRYRNCKILKDKDDGSLLLSTRENLTLSTSIEDSYYRVSSNESERLDLISYECYKNPRLWWVIAQANDIKDPFQYIEPGTLLKIPSIQSLYGNNGLLL